MINFPTRIGEFNLLIKCEKNTRSDFLEEHFVALQYVQNNGPDLVIYIKENFGVPFVDYDVSITKQTNKLVYKRADYLIEVDDVFKNATISVYNELALKHALMNLYSAFLIYHDWGLLVHSSCAVERGEAHLFAGHSGAGKSTIARLSNPRNLLSDEAAILKITKDVVTVFDSPFRSELKSTAHQRPYPLRSIQLLTQSLQNKRVSLSKADALIQLMDKIFYWPHRAEEPTRIIQLLKLLVEQVPVYELHFQRNNTFWELIS